LSVLEATVAATPVLVHCPRPRKAASDPIATLYTGHAGKIAGILPGISMGDSARERRAFGNPPPPYGAVVQVLYRLAMRLVRGR
jgi:hypothetical protein